MLLGKVCNQSVKTMDDHTYFYHEDLARSKLLSAGLFSGVAKRKQTNAMCELGRRVRALIAVANGSDEHAYVRGYASMRSHTENTNSWKNYRLYTNCN